MKLWLSKIHLFFINNKDAVLTYTQIGMFLFALYAIIQTNKIIKDSQVATDKTLNKLTSMDTNTGGINKTMDSIKLKLIDIPTQVNEIDNGLKGLNTIIQEQKALTEKELNKVAILKFKPPNQIYELSAYGSKIINNGDATTTISQIKFIIPKPIPENFNVDAPFYRSYIDDDKTETTILYLNSVNFVVPPKHESDIDIQFIINFKGSVKIKYIILHTHGQNEGEFIIKGLKE